MLKFVDYYADWCGPCKVMKPIFEEVFKEYEGKYEFEQIDVEADSDRAAKAGVMSIPTSIILKDDQEVDRKIGAMPKEALTSWLDSHLS